MSKWLLNVMRKLTQRGVYATHPRHRQKRQLFPESTTEPAKEKVEYESIGTLGKYESFDVTSVVGREFPKLQLTDVLGECQSPRSGHHR